MFMLTFHVAIALITLLVASYAYIKPSRGMLIGALSSAIGTLVSGTALIVLSGADILHACIAGLIFLSIITVLLLLTQRKLAAERIRRK